MSRDELEPVTANEMREWLRRQFVGKAIRREQIAREYGGDPGCVNAARALRRMVATLDRVADAELERLAESNLDDIRTAIGRVGFDYEATYAHGFIAEFFTRESLGLATMRLAEAA